MSERRYEGMSIEQIAAEPNGRRYLKEVSRGTLRITPWVDEVRRWLRENPEARQDIAWLDMPATEGAVAESVPEPTQRRYSLPVRLRWQVLKRDNFRCRICGVRPLSTNDVTLEVDHIRSVRDGGDNSPANLHTLCRRCNAGKSGDSLRVGAE